MDLTKIYIVHYTPLTDRNFFQKKQLSKLNINNYIFIEKYDKENLIKKDICKFNKLRLSQISVFKKFMYVMSLIQQSNYKYNLIFEDDVILNKNFVKSYEKGLKELPDDYDILSIGSAHGFHITKKQGRRKDKLIYKRNINLNATRGTDSLLFSKKCAEKILNFFNCTDKINLPVDFWFNYVVKKLKLNVYWMEPTIVVQGSTTGLFKSTTEI